jgi:hypothetical protein
MGEQMYKKFINAMALGTLLLPAASAMDSDQKSDQLQQVPEAVRKSLLREAADGGRISSVEQEGRDGQQFYKAKIETVDGKWIVKVSPEGTIFDTDKKELEWSKAPQAVQSALLNEVKGGKVVRIDRKVEAGQNTYIAIVDRDGKLDRVYFSELGQELKENRDAVERDVKEGMSRLEKSVQYDEKQLKDLSDAARNTVRRELGSNGRVTDVHRGDKVNGRTVYNVSIDRDGKTKNIQVNEDGDMVQ